MSISGTIKTLASTGPTTLIKADSDMRHVLTKLAGLGPLPIENLSADEARRQPMPSDAVKAIMEDDGISPTSDVTTEDIEIPGAAGNCPARIYRPAEGEDLLPVVLYFHGGGWVIADLDVYDATPRALAEKTGAIVVSAHYRQAPEHKFPAAHDDAVAIYRWLIENAEELGGDTERIAVMGESAGGNLAAHVSIAARDQGLPAPVHQALIYPVASTDIDTPSYEANENAKPLNKAMMQWFVEKVLTDPAEKSDKRLRLIDADLDDLPPATIVTAEIDPLHDDGKRLADALRGAGNEVAYADYDGVTHEFFGMAPVVAKAEEAQNFVAERLRRAFNGGAARI